MRRLLQLCFFILAAAAANAQPYGNEWINHDQRYLKVNIVRNGIYRVDSAAFASALSSIGVPITSVDPRNVQVFAHGEEQHIYVKGEGDGVFNSADFIEFFGHGNDGRLDHQLYVNTPFPLNPYLSQFNDTAVFYITWNSSLANRRLTVETDINFTGYIPENFFWKEEIKNFNGDWYAGETNVFNAKSPQYTKTEGWLEWPPLNLGQTSASYPLNSTNPYTGGPNAQVEIVLTGQSRNASIANPFPDHHISIEYKPSSSSSYTVVADTFFRGYELLKLKREIDPSLLHTSGAEFRYTSIAEPQYTDAGNRTALSYILFKYPHTLSVAGRTSYEMIVNDNAQGKALLNLTNLVTYGTQPFVYDITGKRRIEGALNGSDFSVLVPNSGTGEKRLFLACDYSTEAITSIEAVNTTGYFVDYSANALDSAFIIVTHKKLMGEAVQYKLYRESMPGGGHNVILADVDDLYDQFASGTAKTPLAIRRFCDFLLDRMPSEPQNLFLIGKSLNVSGYKKHAPGNSKILVPTFGSPGSDVLITAGLNSSSSLVPAIPTGRLAASEPEHVRWYLDKVKQYNTSPAADWKKNIIHLAGGSTATEQALCQRYLRDYEEMLEDTFFGGNVVTFKKTSSAPIEINQSDSLKKLINNGVSVMNFFGHANGTGFDQSIDEPQSYNNTGRYPLLVANSCYLGDIHNEATSSSEVFVLIENKGMIGYIAAISVGVSYALNQYSARLMENISSKHYGKSIGFCMKEAIRSNSNTADINILYACMEMTLHGDPSVVINSYPKPDYKITNADVSFDLLSRTDSFTVFAEVRNLGKATNDTIAIELKRTLPNGQLSIKHARVAAPKYSSTYSVTFPSDFTNGPGLNKMSVRVDAFNTISELTESNNTTDDVPFLIYGNDILPVYPYNYAIVPNPEVKLKASTGNPFASHANYIFQIDTSNTFDSPAMRQGTVNAPGGVIEWGPTIQLTDSTVYYWRVSPDSVSSSGYNWKESSFQYISAKQGWSQAHFFQFSRDNYRFMRQNPLQRSYEFASHYNSLKAVNFIFGWAQGVQFGDLGYFVNGSSASVWSCAIPGLSIAVFDSVSGQPWITVNPDNDGPTAPYGNEACFVNDPRKSFDFYDNDSTWRDKMRRFLDTIPDGYPVLIYSQYRHNLSKYEPALLDAIERIGSASIRSISDTVPYIIWGKKGAPAGWAKESIGTSRGSIVTVTDTFISNWHTGHIESEIIGPAVSWGSLHWRFRSLEQSSRDSIYLKLVGIKASGAEDTLATFTPPMLDVADLGSYADPAIYPYLKMVAYMSDDSLHTPPQMERWQVIYTPAPEAALHPVAGYLFHNDTLQEGEDLKLAIAVKNVSESAFGDSLLISYRIVDESRNVHVLPYKLKKAPFNPGEIIIDTLVVSTEGFTGVNSVWMEVNELSHPKHQREQHHHNNVTRLDFYVGSENENPLLDVTFDGVHILNRDIVSAKPSILIQLRDENKYLPLNDSSDFKVFIKTPGQSLMQQIQWGPSLTFTKANLPDNSCRINYTPVFPTDGVYELMVQATDRSSNKSGSVDYSIEFEVVNKATITEVLNYPNPFSTSTRFVFTLTGSEVPSDFRIQIMTITGKVVREIDESEIGPLRIGRNITEYAWDGRDEFGDQLANGVYLYRVLTRINGSEIEKRNTNADQYFTKGFGKMYLIR